MAEIKWPTKNEGRAKSQAGAVVGSVVICGCNAFDQLTTIKKLHKDGSITVASGRRWPKKQWLLKSSIFSKG